MISIINRDNILSEHEIYELTHAFYNGEEIVFSKNKDLRNAKFNLELFKKEFSYNGILVDGSINSNSKEIEFGVLNIYRNELATKRIIAKQVIYKLLEKTSGLSLPWGVLTGIRPTKIVHRIFDLNINSDEILIVLTKGYLLSIEKAGLIIQIAKIQRKILDNISNNSYSLYINIPFCPSRCSYCSFPSLSANQHSREMDEYINTLLKELELSKRMMRNWNINTVYIGGRSSNFLKA